MRLTLWAIRLRETNLRMLHHGTIINEQLTWQAIGTGHL
jgi:hypothetical protein